MLRRQKAVFMPGALVVLMARSCIHSLWFSLTSEFWPTAIYWAQIVAWMLWNTPAAACMTHRRCASLRPRFRSGTSHGMEIAVRFRLNFAKRRAGGFRMFLATFRLAL